MLSAFLGRGALVLWLLAGSLVACAQQAETPAAIAQRIDRQFLLARGIGLSPQTLEGIGAPLQALAAARAQQAKLVAGASLSVSRVKAIAQQSLGSAGTASTTTWQALGPMQVSTPAYGRITGRISSLIVDPNDSSGNTVYIGATGGGVWKSTNAAGSAGSVKFTPLTDNIQPFSRTATSACNGAAVSIPSLSIGAITVQPGNAQVVLAGTGDPNDALDSYYGVGILRSTDGGASWCLVKQSFDPASSANHSFQGLGFAGFAWSSQTSGLVVAAASLSLEGQLVNTGYASTAEAGLYYSTDAGLTWHLSTITDGPNQVIQSANPATSPPGNAVTSVVWNPQRQLFFAAVRFHGYYSSPDGVTWTRLANQPGAGLAAQYCPTTPGGSGSQSCPLFRGALAVQPVTGDTFALTTDITNKDQGLYQDVCSTSGSYAASCSSTTISFGKRIATGALDASGGSIPEADYNLSLAAISLQQDTILLAGTEDIFRCSIANGCAWRNATNNQTCAGAQVAPSVHAIDGRFGAQGLAFFGTDGGLWRTTDDVGQSGSVCASSDASHFQNLNGGIGSLAEISHLAVSPDGLMLAGIGEFGVIADKTADAQAGTGPWQQVLTGEGSFVAVDPTSAADWYAGAGAAVAIFHCPNGDNCDSSGFGAAPVIDRSQIADDADYFINPAPWMLDPLNPRNILLGTCRMWLGPATGGWNSSNVISPILDKGHSSFCNGNAQLRAIGAGGSYNSPQGGEQMYAGMAGPFDGGGSVPGHVYGATVPQGGGVATWSDLWRNPVTVPSTLMNKQFNAGGYAISNIAVDPADATGKTIFVGIQGFPYGQSGELYGSTDGGLHWASITNSLPQAPVNSILVDPNNANYVYVGGDFGIYYTTNIANCVNTSQNCWAPLASGLPNAPVTDLKVLTGPSGQALIAATYGRGIWALGLATTPVVPQATLSPTRYSFAAQSVGTAAPYYRFTLTNTGSVALAIAAINATPSSDYTQANNCGASLASGSSCLVQVTFNPSAAGDRPGVLTVNANTAAGKLTASLDGTGLTPAAVTFSPNSLSFPQTVNGYPSQPMNVTVTNTGQSTLQSLAAASTGTNASEFSKGSGSTCGTTLAAGNSCNFAVVFTPMSSGTRTAIFQITASAQGSPFNVSVSGIGANPAALVLTPSSLTFPSTAQGSSSSAQSIQVTNTGGVPAQLSPAQLSGDYAFASNNCGSSLGPGASCQVAVQFTPTANGSRAGLFTLPSSSIPAKQVTASLSGTGAPPASLSASPGSLSFPAQQQGTTSAAQSVTITNSSGSTAQLGTATLSTQDYAIASNACQGTLAVGSSCTIGVTFTPTAPGARSAILNLPHDGANLSISLSGTGTEPGRLTFSPNPATLPTTAENTTSAPQPISVTNSGGSPAQITSIVPSGPFGVASSDCPVAPQTLAAGASCTVQVAFSPPGTAAYSGSLQFSGSFGNAPASVSLSGQGAAPAAVTLSPGALNFPDTPEGSVSSRQSVTVTSSGGVAVTFSGLSVSADYQIASNNCPTSLAPNATCTVAILFHPGGVGSRSGSFSVAGSMPSSPVSIPLNGMGVMPGSISLNPGAFDFGSGVIGSTSPTQMVTVSNTGGATVGLGTLGVSGDFALSGSTCGASLAAAQSCTVAVAFHPTSEGTRSGLLTVPGDGTGSSASATLSGNGTTPGQVVFTPGSLAFGTVATGDAQTKSITATNSGQNAVHLSSIAEGGDFQVSGGSCSTAVPLAANGGSCSLLVTFAPSAAGNRGSTLTLVNDGSPASAQAALTGVGAAPGNLVLSAAALDFGSIVLNTSARQPVTAKNTGGVPVSLGNPVVTGGGYALQSNDCGSSLGAGQSCTLQVVFMPVAAGSSAGRLSVPWGSGSVASTNLSGAGVTPGQLVFSPSPVAFGQAVINSTVTVPVVAQNTGGAPFSMGSPLASNGFSVSGNCGAALAPNQTCTLQVSFSPVAAGQVAGLLTIPGTNGTASATDALSGEGILPGALTASPGSLQYAALVVGASSAAQTVVLRNPGGVSVPLASAKVSSNQFAVSSSTCGTSLDPGASCTVSVVFTPRAVGDQQATLILAGSAANGPSTGVSLEGLGLAPAHLLFSPASYNFGSQPVRTLSAPQSFTLSNTGQVSTSLSVPVLAGEFAISQNTCGSSLGGGASCAITVRFSPTSSGSQPGSLNITAGGGSLNATVSFTAFAQALVLNPTAYAFSVPIVVGSTATSDGFISVENLGQNAISLVGPTVTGDFALGVSSCGVTLAASSSCSVQVKFSPTAGGLRTGTFTVSGGGETHSTQLSGTGLSPATDTLNPTSLSFGSTVIGHASGAQSVHLTNDGDSTLTQIAVSVTGPFQAVNQCGASLGGHLSCSIAVAYQPGALGTESGALVVSDINRVQTVVLQGQGAAPPSLFTSPQNLDFGPYAVAVATSPQTILISNQGTTPVVSPLITTSSSEYSIGSNTCGAGLAPGASCQVGVGFTPGAIGNRQGVLTVTSPSLNSPLTVSLAGSGEDFQLQVVGSDTQVVTDGQTAGFQLAVTPVGASSGSLTLACSGAPENARCTLNPATVSISGGASGSIQVSVATATAAAAATATNRTSGKRWWAGGAALALLCPFLLVRGEKRRRLLLTLFAAVLLASPIACGVHASGANSAGKTLPGHTASGSYNLTITASFPGAQRTAAVTLIVQ